MRGRWGRCGRRARPALFASLLLAAFSAPAAAQRSLVLESFHGDAAIRPDGTVLVTETMRPRFTGQWNGLQRVLDRQHTTAAGRTTRLEIDVLGATGDDGRALRHEVERRRDGRLQVRVWVPNARDRTATVTLRYRVRGAIRHFAATDEGGGHGEAAGPEQPAGDGAGGAPVVAYDELYWQVTGTEWEVPIRRASGRITLPPGAAPLQAAAYRGAPESGAQAEVRVLDDGVEVVDAGALPPGHGLTLAVAWPAGVVPGPPPEQRSAPVPLAAPGPRAPAAPIPREPAHPLAYAPLLLALGILALCHRAWRRRGRDPRERAITVHWEPPPGLSPAETGTLIDHSPQLHDIVSTLVDLAVRGYLRIEEREKGGLLGRGKDYRFHLLRPRHQWDDLADHERVFLRGLFAQADPAGQAGVHAAARDGALDASLAEVPLLGALVRAFSGDEEPAPPDALETVRLADLENRFYKELPDIRSAILSALVAKGHYLRRPDRVRARWYAMAAATMVAGVVALSAARPAAATANGAALALAFGGAMVAGALVVALYGTLMPARTVQGARAREAALGFRRFLERVESPRYRRMITTPEQFELYLPYAMAFRCEDRWAKAFEDMLTEPPRWYSGTDPVFRPSTFARSMNRLASAAGSSMASSPSSSGSGGGGSVSGGSGGGGGGGF